jgi:hypothetical protein
MISRIDDDGAGLLPALILNDAISRARIARLGLRCYATRQRQGAGDQRDEGATRRLVRLFAHGSLLTVCVRQPWSAINLFATTYERAGDTRRSRWESIQSAKGSNIGNDFDGLL